MKECLTLSGSGKSGDRLAARHAPVRGSCERRGHCSGALGYVQAASQRGSEELEKGQEGQEKRCKARRQVRRQTGPGVPSGPGGEEGEREAVAYERKVESL